MKRIPFIQARNFTPVVSRVIDWVVIHDMEAPEAQDTAENVAKWFAGATAPKASPHYNVDSDSIVQSVHDHDVAWHAPGANHNGLGVEHAGYARQTKGQWDDAYSHAMLDLSAELVSSLCDTYRLPVRFVDAAGLRAGRKGITTHAEVSKAFPVADGHTDPGPNFPMLAYIAKVKAARFTGPKPSENPLPGPRPIPKWFWTWATWRFGGRIWERPDGAPNPIPPWAWAALKQLQENRKRGTT